MAGLVRARADAGATVQKLNALVREDLQAPEHGARPWRSNSLQPVTQAPEEFARMVADTTSARWAPIVKATGFTAEE